jgi:16S rRNA (guanine527-N7)-methyltransferase
MPVDAQIDHALGFVMILEERFGGAPDSVVDLGTGGGVPGLVLISCWPGARVVMLDAGERRTHFLEETVRGWPEAGGAQVIRGRAEELGRRPELRERFAAATSRSFGVPSLTAECGSAFLAEGGALVVSEPPEGSSGERWPQEGLARVGLAAAAGARVSDRFGYQLLVKVGPLDDRYPRRVGIPAKRPLF